MPLRARNKTNDNSYLVQYHEDEIFQVRPSGMIVAENEVSSCVLQIIFIHVNMHCFFLIEGSKDLDQPK